MTNNANTNNKQQQYTSNNTYSSNTNTNNNTRNNKPNFTNSKGTVNNNIPLNPNAKVEKQENLKDVKTKVAGIFQKTNDENENVKAPKKEPISRILVSVLLYELKKLTISFIVLI